MLTYVLLSKRMPGSAPMSGTVGLTSYIVDAARSASTGVISWVKEAASD